MLLSEAREVAERNRELTDHLLLALAAGELGTFRWDKTTGVTTWDATTERLFGMAPGTFDGTYEAWTRCCTPTSAMRCWPSSTRPSSGSRATRSTIE